MSEVNAAPHSVIGADSTKTYSPSKHSKLFLFTKIFP